MTKRPRLPQQKTQQLTASFEASSFSGPLPPPQMLADYEKAQPGAGSRIFQLTEKEQDHRHNLESRNLTWVGTIQIIGQCMGFLLGLAGIGGGIFLLYSGKSIEGYVTMVGTLVSLLLANQKKKQQSRD